MSDESSMRCERDDVLPYHATNDCERVVRELCQRFGLEAVGRALERVRRDESRGDAGFLSTDDDSERARPRSGRRPKWKSEEFLAIWLVVESWRRRVDPPMRVSKACRELWKQRNSRDAGRTIIAVLRERDDRDPTTGKVTRRGAVIQQPLMVEKLESLRRRYYAACDYR